MPPTANSPTADGAAADMTPGNRSKSNVFRMT